MVMGLVLFSFQLFAQSSYKVGPNVELKVTGTSTIHDWEMVSNQATGQGNLIIENGKLQAVKKLSVQMPAESIKSGKSAMDKNTYTSLNTKKHPQINFELADLSKVGEGLWKAKGNFTIAGVTKPASFEVKSSQVGEKVKFEGKYPFKLTDYQIDPPTAMFGTIKTGEEVTIHFNITLEPTS